MAITTRLLGDFHLDILDCPRRTEGESRDACRRCPHNVCFPSQAEIGCVVRTPIEVYEAARSHLRERSPELSSELEALITRVGELPGGLDDTITERWLRLAERWFAQLPPGGGAASEREVAQVIARFARAAREKSRRVQILG